MYPAPMSGNQHGLALVQSAGAYPRRLNANNDLTGGYVKHDFFACADVGGKLAVDSYSVYRKD